MTPDDDFELDELKGAWNAAAPRPNPEVRAAHLRLAQENFDRLQGTAQAARPGCPAPWPRPSLRAGGMVCISRTGARRPADAAAISAIGPSSNSAATRISVAQISAAVP